jgi:hypothetical protein
MDRRPDLHDLLKEVLGSDLVYFQPPPNVQLQYPCIVYERDAAKVEYADNVGYTGTFRYQVTYINQRPDGDTIYKLLLLPRCSYNRFYVANKLNHDVFNIYY